MGDEVRYRAMGLRVRGRAARGDIVCHEGGPPQARVFRVEEPADRAGRYQLRNLDTHTAEYSDLIDPEWRFASLIEG